MHMLRDSSDSKSTLSPNIIVLMQVKGGPHLDITMAHDVHEHSVLTSYMVHQGMANLHLFRLTNARNTIISGYNLFRKSRTSFLNSMLSFHKGLSRANHIHIPLLFINPNRLDYYKILLRKYIKCDCVITGTWARTRWPGSDTRWLGLPDYGAVVREVRGSKPGVATTLSLTLFRVR